MTDQKESGKRIIPVREGLFNVPSRPGEKTSLFGSRCKSCSQISFPPRSICLNCFNEDIERITLNPNGKLYSYTVIGYPPPGTTAPYAIGYVDLPEGVRVFSVFKDWDKTGLKLGMEMELVLGKLREHEEGNDIITYKFRPAQEPGRK